MSLASYSLNTDKSVILQSTDTKVSSASLKQSAATIAARLKTYGLESSVSVIPGKGQIKVQIPDSTDVREIKGLLTTRGILGFYEILTLKEIADLSGQATNARPSDARLGCSTYENRHISDSVENHLKSLNLASDYQLVWGFRKSKDTICLFAIKTKDTGTSPLARSDVESIKASKTSDSQSFMIEIKFKPAASKIWALTTRNNLGKPVAIVIDGKVFYRPVVKTPIEDGLCQITGNMTQKEINYFLALVNNDPLPVEFILK